MAERYTKLSPLERNLYTPGSPVVILAGSLLRDNETGKVLGQFKFKNIADKIIKALVIKVDAYDVSGKELPGVAEYQYLDLFAQRDAEFGQKSAVILPESITRSVQVQCISAVFADDTQWAAHHDAVWSPLPTQQTVADAIGSALAEQYRRTTTAKAKFVLKDHGDLWLCACGGINHIEEAECHTCGNAKIELTQALDEETLTEGLNKHRADMQAIAEEEERERAKKAAEQAVLRKKTAKIFAISAVIAMIIAAGLLLNKYILIPLREYNDAIALMDAGQYSEAIAAFEALDGYKDSAEQITECNYNEALALMDAGKYTEAIEAFNALGGYKDSTDKIDDCNIAILEEKYNEALALMNDGRYYDALGLFTSLSLKGYRDSNAMVYECQTGRFNEKYNEALALKNEGNQGAAAAIFREIRKIPVSPGLKDEASYQLALCLIEQKLYVEAREVLLEIKSHTEAAALLEKFHYRITALIERKSDYGTIEDTLRFEYEFDDNGNLKRLTLTDKGGDTTVYTYVDGVVNSCEYTDFVFDYWTWMKIDREWKFKYSIEGSVFHRDCTVTRPGERSVDSDSYNIFRAADGSRQLNLNGDDSYMGRINSIGFYEVIPVSSGRKYELEWTLFFDDNHLDGLDYLLLYVQRI